MSLFLCTRCGCIENTAGSGYRGRNYQALSRGLPKPDPLCSACNPDVGEWHGTFPRRVPAPECVQPNQLGAPYVDIVGDAHDVARCMCATCETARHGETIAHADARNGTCTALLAVALLSLIGCREPSRPMTVEEWWLAHLEAAAHDDRFCEIDLSRSIVGYHMCDDGDGLQITGHAMGLMR